MSDHKNTFVRLAPEERKRLRMEAARRDISLSDALRLAVAGFLKASKPAKSAEGK